MPRDGSSCVRAVVRVRPLLPHEVEKGEKNCCEVQDAHSILIQNGPHRNWRQYSFDACLEGAKSQKQVFQECGINTLMDSAVQGYAATVLAYGQTGSGKTYTMMGRHDRPDATGRGAEDVKREDGIIMRSAKRLFKRVGTEAAVSQSTFAVSASFTEIYNAPGAVNECICDLLSPDAAGKNLQVRYNQKHGFYVSDLCVVDCASAADVRAVLEAGIQNRRVGAHALNKDSSRSHALFTMYIDSEWADGNGGDYPCGKRFGKITFVDLAGSERLKESLAEGQARKETQAINKSLFTLGQVISQLSQGKAEKHVPYRNSKLTQLLQESFGGEALCLMVTCISPAAIFAEESLNSLNYAQKAMNIRNRPVVRLDERQQMLHDLKAENAALRRELELYKAKYGPLSPRSLVGHAASSLPSGGGANCQQVEAAFAALPEETDNLVASPVSAKEEMGARRRNRPASTEKVASSERQAQHELGRSGSARQVGEASRAAGRGRSEPPALPPAVVCATSEAVPSVPTPPAPLPSPSAPVAVTPSPAQSPAIGGYAKAAQRRKNALESRTRNPPSVAHGNSRRVASGSRSLPPLPGRTTSGGSAPAECRRVQTGEEICLPAQASSARTSLNKEDCKSARQVSAATGPDNRSCQIASGGDSRPATRGCARQVTPRPGVSPVATPKSSEQSRGSVARDGSECCEASHTVGTPLPRQSLVPSTTVLTLAKQVAVVECEKALASGVSISRQASAERLMPQLTRTQIEHLDTAHWSEWQFNFHTEGSACREAGDPDKGGIGNKRESRAGSGDSSRSGSASSLGHRCGSARSVTSSTAATSTLSSARRLSWVPAAGAASVDYAASHDQASSSRPGTNSALRPGAAGGPGDGFQHMSLAELNSKLSSMQLATSALLQAEEDAGH